MKASLFYVRYVYTVLFKKQENKSSFEVHQETTKPNLNKLKVALTRSYIC